jgi:hypothetical protein
MLADQLIRAFGSPDQTDFDVALNELSSAVPGLEPAVVAENAVALAGEIHRAPVGVGSYVAQLLAGMCDFGADPVAVSPALVDGVLRVLGNLKRFKALCAEAGLDVPSSGDEKAFLTTMRALAAALGDTHELREIAEFTESWFAGDGWIRPVLFLLQRKDVRVSLPRRKELTGAAEAAAEDLSTAPWLYGLLLVLDDERFVVLHRATAQGWLCTMSGIGDNFQLHTLLGGRLAEMVGATPPNAVELAAAGTGDMRPEGGIRGTFNLVAATGEWIWNEDRPADIPSHGGIRVVVLDPPPYERSWNVGRLYPLMAPSLTVDGRLPPDDAARWLSTVKPANP